MPFIPFPNVPNDPGVPPIPRGVLASTQEVVELLTGGSTGGLFGGDFFGLNTDAPQWGFFDQDGNPLILADNVLTFEGVKESRIADYPVEEGGFESYNKVEVPGEVRVRYSTGAGLGERTDMIDSVSDACASLDLYTAVMPEKTFEGVNLTHYDFRREVNNGVGLLIIEVWGQEVRNTATAEFTNTTQTPAGADPSNVGPVQPEKLTGQDKAAVADGAT